MTLKLNGSSSGSVSLDAPASTTGGADVTFKLPVADGSSGQALTTNASGQLAFATVAGGKILQVVSAETTTETSITSTTFTDTTLTGTITPSATSSKIWVITNQRWTMDRAAIGLYAGIQLLRDSTVIIAGSQYCHGIQVNGNGGNWLGMRDRITWMKMDSPNTTSAVTYKTQGTCGNTTANSAAVKFQEDSEVSSIFLLEIGA